MTIRGSESRHTDGSLCKKNLVARMLQEVAMSHDQKAVFKKSKLILKISTLQKLLKNHIKYLKLY